MTGQLHSIPIWCWMRRQKSKSILEMSRKCQLTWLRKDTVLHNKENPPSSSVTTTFSRRNALSSTTLRWRRLRRLRWQRSSCLAPSLKNTQSLSGRWSLRLFRDTLKMWENHAPRSESTKSRSSTRKCCTRRSPQNPASKIQSRTLRKEWATRAAWKRN